MNGMSFWSATDDKKNIRIESFQNFQSVNIATNILNAKRYQSSKIHFICGYSFGRKYSLFKIVHKKKFLPKYVSLTWHQASLSLLHLISQIFSKPK